MNTTEASPRTCLLADQTINSDSKFQICFSWTDNFFWLLYLRLCKRGPHLPFFPLEGDGFWELREIRITTSKCRKQHFHKQEFIREHLARKIKQKLLQSTVWALIFTKEKYFLNFYRSCFTGYFFRLELVSLHENLILRWKFGSQIHIPYFQVNFDTKMHTWPTVSILTLSNTVGKAQDITHWFHKQICIIYSVQHQTKRDPPSDHSLGMTINNKNT